MKSPDGARASRPPEDVRARLHEPQKTARGRLAADRAATWLVTAGGLAIIASILAILVFIVLEVWPLTHPTQVAVGEPVSLGSASLAAVVTDEHRSHLVGLGLDGVVREIDLTSGRARDLADLGTPLVAASAVPATATLSGLAADGRVMLVPVEFRISFVDGVRQVTPRLGTAVEIATGVTDPGPYAARLASDGGAVVAVAGESSVTLVTREVDSNPLAVGAEEDDDEEAVTEDRSTVRVAYAPSSLALDSRSRNLFAGTPGGELLWWRLDGARADDLQVVSAAGAVTALALLIGDQSLVVGQADGGLSIWFPVRQEAAEGDNAFRLTRIRDFPSLGSAVERIEPSRRGKGFLATDAAGAAGLYHSTSARVLWQGDLGLETVAGTTYAPKADGAFVVGGQGERAELVTLEIDNPHPEVSWRTLFGKVHYEGYQEPEHVWQSSGATDEVEPKLSLTPLLVGTLKGTFYSLLIAIPLAILGAMYLSQFMHPVYKRYVKPVIEIMASLPSVVLGFLAGLWLAPRVEEAMPGLILMALILPLTVWVTGWLYTRLPKTFRTRVPTGSEMFLFALALAGGIWLATALGPGFEALAFGGDFQTWLRETTGLAYDQRNAVIVGLAMGFAVIPIIFAISEDAFSNVPQNLVAGSLALGANRWQTVTRVVLPTASPGIFSAVMVGFGRAVGETMIVLMATGNTPIMDWNPFNGFRTLSANIAVEIPEAPQHGTLYRTLFLAALLLFVLTFVLNTVAELVRQRLRERYSQL
jgi:phosphate transport system permease protein